MGFSPHLLLLILGPLATFLDFSLAIDRTSWNHVCGGGPYQPLQSCDYRKKIIETLKKIRTTANTVITTPFRADPKFKDCWDEIYYERNRTEEKFKNEIESSIGVTLHEYITKMAEAVNAIEQHDISVGSLLRDVDNWRMCAVERKSEEDCGMQAAQLEMHNPVPTRFGNDTVDFKNTIARLSHLQKRNSFRSAAAQLVHAFHDAVTNAHTVVVQKRIWRGSLCESRADMLKNPSLHSAYSLVTLTGERVRGMERRILHPDSPSEPFVFQTDFTTDLNEQAISINNDFHEMEKIDQRTKAYLKLLEEFRSCETIRGRYNLDCAEIRIKADKIDPRDIVLQNKPNLDESDHPTVMKEKKEKPRKLLYPSVGFFRPALGPTHLMTRVYEKETENKLSEFFNGVKNTIASTTDDIINGAASLFEKAKSSSNCEKFIRETPIVSEANELSLIHNITQEIVRFRSKFEQYVTVEDEYVACVEKQLESETEETVKAICNAAALINERKKLLAIVNAASTHESLARHRRFFPHTAVSADKALLGNQIWAGSWGNLQSKMDDMKAIGDHAWLTASAAPSKLIQKLSSSAQCEAELYDGKFQAGSPDLNKFDESWKNTLVVFDKLNRRMEKEFAIYELLTKLAVCSDENEFSCSYLSKSIENLVV